MGTELQVRSRGCKMQTPSLMPAERAERLAGLLKALADPTRVQMLYMLLRAPEPICVCDFTQVFALSQPTVSHHVAKLREAGLVDARRDGVWTYYSLRRDLAPEALNLVEAIRSETKREGDQAVIAASAGQ